jgi:colanic acid/amylovoran biosynthesis glycosyltransferase
MHVPISGTDRRVAYLINQYPKVSHSFIRTEVLELERQGWTVERHALRGWDAELVDPLDQSERSRTRYVLAGGAAALARAMLAVAARSPRRFVQAFRLATRMARGSERPLAIHWIYLAEACLLLTRFRETGVRHVHAHFGSNSTEVAMLSHALGGPGYSFTVHGPEEFDKPEALHLREKIARARFVVAITSFCRSQLFRWSATGDWPKMQEVHCALDDVFFVDAPPGQRNRLVCIGRLCEQKGQLLLVEACRLLRDRGIAVDLVLAGDGEMRDEIEQRIAAFGLQDRVRITGWISGDQVRDELRQAGTLVLPSFAEGLPVVIMEAMASGRPPITTYIAGIPELVRDGENGLLIPAGDVDALADAIERFLALSDQEVEAMGARARAAARSRHHVRDEVAKLATLFDAALQSAL